MASLYKIEIKISYVLNFEANKLQDARNNCSLIIFNLRQVFSKYGSVAYRIFKIDTINDIYFK